MPHLDPVLLSDARVVAAYAIFIGSYFVFALGKFPGMKIDRPGAAIIGAVLMVAFRIVGAQEALQSVDFATIVLLFSMMLIVANLRLGGFFERIAEWIVERLQPHHLLPTVIFTCGWRSDLDPEIARRAGAVLNHYRLPKLFSKLQLDDARHEVRRAARCKRHDHPDRPVRVLVSSEGTGDRGGQKQRQERITQPA